MCESRHLQAIPPFALAVRNSCVRHGSAALRDAQGAGCRLLQSSAANRERSVHFQNNSWGLASMCLPPLWTLEPEYRLPVTPVAV